MSQPFASPGPNPGQPPHPARAGVPRPAAASAAAPDPFPPLHAPLELVPHPPAPPPPPPPPPRGRRLGSALPDFPSRTFRVLKPDDPDWGCQKVSDLLLRGPALPASPSAVARVLHEAGYQLDDVPTRPHPEPVRHFERARPN